MGARAVRFSAVRPRQWWFPRTGRYNMHGARQRPGAVALRTSDYNMAYTKEMPAASTHITVVWCG